MSASSAALRPRAHVHRGTVVATAFWFHPGTLGESEARRRVLAAWMPGATVWALAGGHLLRLAAPRKVAVEHAPGLPLVMEAGVLTSAPLTPKERERLSPPPGSVVLVHEGVATLHTPGALRPVDPGAWLDVSAWRRVRVTGLGAPPPDMQDVLQPLPPPTRAWFGPKVPALAPEAQRMLARMTGLELPAAPEGFLVRLKRAFSRKPRGATAVALREESSARRGGLLSRLRQAFRAGRTGSREGVAAPGRTGLLKRLWGALFVGARASKSHVPEAGTPGALTRRASRPGPWRWLFGSAGIPAGWLSRLLGGWPDPAGTSASHASEPPRPSEPRGPGALERMKKWMLQHTPLGPLVGQRKGDYLRHLFDLFEQGNLDEALRHAVPLGKDLDARAKLALGIPGPRQELRIRPRGRGGAAQVFGGGPQVFEALRERYRETFRLLARAGRIDEAAFVLAELLDAAEEAVSFLEQHGRLVLAAELAEGRNLPASLVVRQWFLAKDAERAVAIARRSGAFADAVLRLEKTHPPEALALRRLWAESLAEAGDWARAVDAIWRVPGARPLARAWVDRGMRAGGVSGAKLLARLALGFEDGFGAARADVEALLSDDVPERAPERLAFATELLRDDPSDARATLLVPTLRALMRDAFMEVPLPLNALIHQLRSLSTPGVAALYTDLPAPKAVHAKPWAESRDLPSVQVWMDVNDAGAHAVHDAVVLPGRRVLLALGEAGARLVGADGRTLAGFDVPAFALVISTQGNRALALARRGDLWRLSRLDLVERRASRWCDTELDAWATTYDGDRWFTAVRDTVRMVDTLAPEPRALWRVAEPGGAVLSLAVDAKHLSFLVLHLASDQDFQRLERWTYELEGGPTLRQRADVPDLTWTPDVHSLTADGEVLAGRSVRPEGEEPAPWPFLLPFSSRRLRELPWRDPRRVGVVLGRSWSVTRCVSGEVQQAHLTDLAGHPRATFLFSGAPPQVVRLTDDWCLVHDRFGRVVWLDLDSGEVHRVPVV